MSLRKVTTDQAFTLLRLSSENTNRRLHNVALEVIDTRVSVSTQSSPSPSRPFLYEHLRTFEDGRVVGPSTETSCSPSCPWTKHFGGVNSFHFRSCQHAVDLAE